MIKLDSSLFNITVTIVLCSLCNIPFSTKFEVNYLHTVTTHFSQEMQIENKKYSFNSYQQYHMLISVVPVYNVGIECISIIP
jgi:hypothetical protein